MPHIIVKLYPGRSEEQKRELTEKIVENVVSITQCNETSVSLAFEEIKPENWPQEVYKSDILEGNGVLYKEPGYNPFSDETKTRDTTDGLMEYVRGAAQTAMQEDATGYFNAMSWLDLELEDNPEAFDRFFDTPWAELSDKEKQERVMTVRAVL